MASIASAQNSATRSCADVGVLHIFSYFRPEFTGEGIYFEKIRPFISVNGLRNDVLVLRPLGRDVAGATVTAPSQIGPIYVLRRSKRQIQRSLRLLWWMLRHGRGYRIVHFHGHCDRYFAVYLALRLLGCRIVQSCTLNDSPGELLETYRSLYRPLVARLLRLVNVFVVISPRLWTLAVEVVPRDCLRLIPQGTLVVPPATQSREKLRERLGFSSDDKLLLYVGGIVERKDPLFLVENMPRLIPTISRLKLLIVGPVLNAAYGERLVRRVAELGLQDCVHFRGFVDDPRPYYNACDLFVFNSHLEGFGNVLIEAMAHGLPVISRALIGVTDFVIGPDEAGFLFDSADHYCALVQRLIGDDALRRRVSETARRRVEEKFHLAVVADRYCNLYASVASKGKMRDLG